MMNAYLPNRVTSMMKKTRSKVICTPKVRQKTFWGFLMSIKKRKKNNLSDLLRYMDLLDAGYAFEHISATYGIHAGHLKVLRSKYLQQGPVGLEKGKSIKADFELRKRIVLEVEKKHLPLHVASLKFGAAPQTICRWLKAYREEGLSALGESKKRGKVSSMGRPKKNSKPLSELEQLRKENQELKTENALLKKVRALVEERNARLRAIGQVPSKN